MTTTRLSIYLAVGTVALIGGYAAFILIVTWPVSFANLDKAGVFGDSFGVLSALFSGLAFAGLLVTILQQREDLQVQRESLKARQCRRTRATRDDKAPKLRKYAVSNTSGLQSDIVNAIDLRKERRTGAVLMTIGRDCFVIFYERLQGMYTSVQRRGTEPGVNKLERAYEIFWKEHQTELGHYFRHLYRIFIFLEASSVVDKVFTRRSSERSCQTRSC